MKAYIGNKSIILAEPEVKEEVDGYAVVYPDGSETWLTKEIVDFEYRELTDDEFDLVITSVVEDIDINELLEETDEEVEVDEVIDDLDGEVEPEVFFGEVKEEVE